MNRTDGTAGTDTSAPLQGDVEPGSGSLSGGAVDSRRSGKSSGHHTRCPICGLALQVVSQGSVLELHYDFAVWDRACKTPDLGGPSICLARACEPAAEPYDHDPLHRVDRLSDRR